MKILILSSLAFDTGSAVRAELMARALKEAKFKVDFVKPFPRTLPLRLDFLFSLPWYLLKVIISLPDFVLAVKSYPNVGVPLLLAKLAGEKIIIDTDDLSFAYSEGWLSRLSKLSQEIFLPLADLHTCHNPFLADYLKRRLKIPSDRVYQLRQGVNSDFFEQILPQEREKLKKALGLGREKILVFVGHFDAACDLENILEVMPIVFKEIQDVKLILIGDGPKRREFYRLAKRLGIMEKIIWTGLVSRRQVISLVSLADVCLLYYRDKKVNYFRSSMKLREYLALGKRVVCNDVGELRDFRDFTYQVSSDLADLTKMIIKVLNGFSDKREIRGRDFVRRNYSWEKIGQDLSRRLKNV